MNRQNKWLHGRMYEGQTIVIIGQGPSAEKYDIRKLTEYFNCVFIKDTFRLASFIKHDIVYACDKNWWHRTWHKNDGLRECSFRRVTLDYDNMELEVPHMHYLHYAGVYNFIFREGEVAHGQNSGHSAINMVVNMGAKKIILLGYDMRAVEGKTHFELCPHVPVPVDVFSMFRQNLTQAAKLLIGKVDVVNCSPNSALKCFVQASIPEAIEWGLL